MDVITATDVLLASGHGTSQSGDTYSADCTYIYEIYIAPSCPLLHIFWYLVALFLPAVEGSFLPLIARFCSAMSVNFPLKSRGFALQYREVFPERRAVFPESRVAFPCSVGQFSPKVGGFSPAGSGGFPLRGPYL